MKNRTDRHVIATIMGLLPLVALVATPQRALAEEEPRSGAYVGIGPAFGFEAFKNTRGIDPDEAFGFDAWGGYRFADFVSAELALEYLNGFDFKFAGVGVDGQALAFTGNVKAFPLARVLPGWADPFLYAGIGLGWAKYDAGSFGDTDQTEFIARFGGGLDVYVTDNVALQASSSYILPTGDLDDFAYVSLVFGIQYRFGGP